MSSMGAPLRVYKFGPPSWQCFSPPNTIRTPTPFQLGCPFPTARAPPPPRTSLNKWGRARARSSNQSHAPWLSPRIVGVCGCGGVRREHHEPGPLPSWDPLPALWIDAPDTPRVVRSPIVRSGKALPPSSVTATTLGLLRTFCLEVIS